MRRIIKGREPATLTQHRQMAHANYDNYLDKDALRESLVTEQRGLCCYCLCRVRPEFPRMKIAHWHSRAKYPNEQLAYSNLLAACLGNQGQRRSEQHCDTRQGENDLSRNPANPDHQIESFIRFEGDGQITSQDGDFDRQLNEVLNLNSAFLKNGRKAILEGFKSTISKRGTLSRSTLERWLRDWNGESDNGELRPYCQVIVYWLRKRLARL